MPRQMPKKGFYVLKRGPYVTSHNPAHEIIYTTGVRGGGGHKHWRCTDAHYIFPSKNLNDWTILAWNCVPGKNDIGNYDYFCNLGSALATY